MNYYKVFLLLVLFLSFSLYFIRPNFIGNDVYAFYFKSCHASIQLADSPLISEYFFKNLPCSIPLMKIVSMLFFFLWVLVVQQFVKYFIPEHSWEAMIFILLVPTIFGWFWDFEDDVLAYPLLVFSLLLFIRSRIEKKKLLEAISFLIISFIGLFIWRGALIYVFALSFFSIPFMGLLLLTIGVFGFYRVFGSLLPALDPLNGLLYENTPFVGILTLIGLFPSFLYIRKSFKYLFIVFLLLLIFSSRLAIHLIPFMIIGMYDFWVELMKWLRSTHDWIIPNAYFTGLKVFFILLLGFLFFNSQYNYLIKGEPTIKIFDMIHEAKQYSIDYNLPIKNEWGFGYYMKFVGIDTNYYGGWRPNLDLNHSVALSTDYNLSCEKLYETHSSAITNAFIYYCP